MPPNVRSTQVIYVYDPATLAYVEWDGSLETGSLVIGAVTQSGAWTFSANSLPLPTGAATNTTLASLLTELQAKADLAETQPVSLASAPLPADAATQTTLALIKAKTDNLDVLLSTRTKPADTQPVSAASLPLPSDAATQTTLALIKAKTDNLDALLSLVATQATLASLLTELQLKADLTETQPVSGPLTDTQLRAATVPISGTVTANAGSGTLAVSGPVTDAQLRATAVPVSLGAAIGANVEKIDDDAGYADADLAKAITQTPTGHLKVLTSGLVSDTRESYVDATVRSLSLTTDGRLRVASSDLVVPTMEDLTGDFSSTHAALWPRACGDPLEGITQ